MLSKLLIIYNLDIGRWERVVDIGGWVKKILEIAILADFVGRKVLDIIDVINDSTKNPPWKGE